jgi:hypothetical protein
MVTREVGHLVGVSIAGSLGRPNAPPGRHATGRVDVVVCVSLLFFDGLTKRAP